LAPRARATEDLRINGVTEKLGTAISWVRVSSTGRVAIGDGNTFDIRFYDSTGKALAVYKGQRMSAPGAWASGWFGDTLWTYDPQRRFIAVISPDVKLQRSVALASQFLDRNGREGVRFVPCPRTTAA
jgi:hypothetical protein